MRVPGITCKDRNQSIGTDPAAGGACRQAKCCMGVAWTAPSAASRAESKERLRCHQRRGLVCNLIIFEVKRAAGGAGSGRARNTVRVRTHSSWCWHRHVAMIPPILLRFCDRLKYAALTSYSCECCGVVQEPKGHA